MSVDVKNALLGVMRYKIMDSYANVTFDERREILLQRIHPQACIHPRDVEGGLIMVALTACICRSGARVYCGARRRFLQDPHVEFESARSYEPLCKLSV
jgi:hypothetical protein